MGKRAAEFLSAQAEDHVDCGLHLDGFIVQQIRPVAPLPNRIHRRLLQHGRPAGHDNEACTVSFGRDVLCQDIVILTGQGDLQTSWTIQWPATGTRGPASFDGVIDGGTAHFAAAHGTFHAATLPDGDMQITAVIDAGPR